MLLTRPRRSLLFRIPGGHVVRISRGGRITLLPSIHGGAAPTRVRGGSATTLSTTPRVTLAGTPTTGNLLVGWVQLNAGNVSRTLSPAGAWSEIQQVVGTGTTAKGALYWKIAASEGTLQQPAAIDVACDWGCVVSEWSSALGWPANPLVIHDEQVFAAATASYTTPSVTPTAGLDALVVCGYSASDSGRTFSAHAVSGSNVGTVTEDGDVNGGAMSTAAISGTTGAYQGSATASSSRPGVSAIAIFRVNVPGSLPVFSAALRVLRRPRRFW